MKNEIKYTKDDVFSKLTKKQKLSLKVCFGYEDIEIDKFVLIPTNKKSGGYYLGEFFAHTPNKGWWRPLSKPVLFFE